MAMPVASPATRVVSRAAGVAETLCFQVVLPPNTDRQFMAASTTVAFVFAAEQIAHTP